MGTRRTGARPGPVRHLASRERRVELVDADRQPALAACPLGESDVVRVAVGQDDGPDVLEAAAHRRELGRQVRPVARHPGVDDRDLTALLDEVRVDDAAPEPMDPIADLHGSRASQGPGGGVRRSIRSR